MPCGRRRGLSGDVGDGLRRARHRHPHRVLLVEGLHQIHKDHPVRVVLDHADLLTDDPLLLVHALLGEIGNGDEGEQDAQVLLEFLCALEIVACDGVAGEGVGGGAVGRQLLEALPSLVSNILCSR